MNIRLVNYILVNFLLVNIGECFARITEPSNDDYDNDVSDNCDNNFGTFDDFGVKNDQKVSHNMILMSKYKGQHGGKTGSKNSGRGLPPSLFGQCPKENIFFCRRCSLSHHHFMTNACKCYSPFCVLTSEIQLMLLPYPIVYHIPTPLSVPDYISSSTLPPGQVGLKFELPKTQVGQ